jgi:glycosyltransferase involved in cell wall biosynthesis
MIRVGFLGYESNYQGGINYLTNLFYAVRQLKDPKIEVIVFVGKKDDYQAKVYGKYSQVIRTAALDRYSFLWFINKASYKLIKYPIIIDILLRLNSIDVLSHSYLTSKFFKAKIINWIPDFQVLHCPELWDEKDIKKWYKLLSNIAINSDRVILSSYDALKDFKSCMPTEENKVDVLQFVSQPPIKSKSISVAELKIKYGFSEEFFFIPNQFWKHKNHKVVYEACALLKKKGLNILVLCSGLMQDFRTKDNSYVNNLIKYSKENDLGNNIKSLGLIDYNDVLCLMENSVAVVNPSLFEGWSSIVEESKSIGKKIILSNIDVHIEQNPDKSNYFDPQNPKELSLILEKLWNERNNIQKLGDRTLEDRTQQFGESYSDLVCEIIKQNEK